ncbi:MAG: hypothetical protein LBO65_06105 [Spirochaetaceae bacterium]|jgi:hypothetical protein|nr:hypothetical protein [Spirochaetaceae bacterium]
MTIFCFLWTPLFYLFWRSLQDESALEGGTWALLLGSVVAFFQFFLGSLVNAGGFGLSRWISACIDVVALPAALPYVVCLIFIALRFISSDANFTNYAFLWLIPVAAVRALGWSSLRDPILLVGAPVLWTAVVVGIGHFVRILQNNWGWLAVPAVLGAVALPLAAATAYWALFAQYTVLGMVLLGLSLVPMLISLGMTFWENRGLF